jgi:hypothetical protein
MTGLNLCWKIIFLSLFFFLFFLFSSKRAEWRCMAVEEDFSFSFVISVSTSHDVVDGESSALFRQLAAAHRVVMVRR